MTTDPLKELEQRRLRAWREFCAIRLKGDKHPEYWCKLDDYRKAEAAYNLAYTLKQQAQNDH